MLHRLVNLAQGRVLHLRARVILFFLMDETQLLRLELLPFLGWRCLLLCLVLLVIYLLLRVFSTLNKVLHGVVRPKTAELPVLDGLRWTLVNLFGKSTCLDALAQRNESSSLL